MLIARPNNSPLDGADGTSQRSWSTTRIAVTASSATDARRGKASPTSSRSALSAASGAYVGPDVASANQVRSCSIGPGSVSAACGGGPLPAAGHRLERLEGPRPIACPALRDEAHVHAGALEDARGHRRPMPGPAEHRDFFAGPQVPDVLREIRDEDVLGVRHHALVAPFDRLAHVDQGPRGPAFGSLLRELRHGGRRIPG